MSKRFLFVGEQPSPTAYENGWTWKSGRLAAKTLFDALRAHRIDPDQCGFVNLFGDTPVTPTGEEIFARRRCIAAAADAGVEIVALGKQVSMFLTQGGVEHRKLRHPAARGRGRATAAYWSHVKEVLCQPST